MIFKLPKEIKRLECTYCLRLFTVFQKRMSAVLTLHVADLKFGLMNNETRYLSNT
jgi:hypothetical protein